MGKAEGGIAHENAPRLGRCLEAGRDVDCVAVDPAIMVDHITDMRPDADRQRPPALRRLLGDPGLQLDSEGDRLDGARELEDEPVPGDGHHTAAMWGGERLDEVAMQALQALDRADLVALHVPCVAHDIGSDDRAQKAPGLGPRGGSRHRLIGRV